MTIRYRYDTDADALDIRLREDAVVARTEQIDSGTLIDLDQDGEVIAIEVLRPARRWPLDEILERFSLDEEQAEILRSQWGAPRSYPFAEPTEVGAGSDAGDFVLA
jgi:uncharacterized protein YuzE